MLKLYFNNYSEGKGSPYPLYNDYPFKTFIKVVPSSDGDSEIVIPALLIASILSSAPPLPPETIAPA